jgi:hypothetical protein
MAVNIHRRQAFTRSFRAYPEILFAALDRIVFYDKSNDSVFVPDPLYANRVPAIMLAQFFVRLIRTRAEKSDNPLLQAFWHEMVHRYIMKSAELTNGAVIRMYPGVLSAVTAIEADMAILIIDALTVEAGDKKFDEADFWKDLALAFFDAWPIKLLHPMDMLQPVFLDNMADFRIALDGPIQVTIDG